MGATTPYGIATANPDDTLQTLVGPTCQEGSTAPCAANASWSRDGQRIAFDRGGAIRTTDADGTRVLFHRNASGNRTIHSVNLSAADLRLQIQGVEGRGRNVFSVSQQPLP